MRGTKELYDLMSQFEKDCRGLIYGHIVKRYTSEDYANHPNMPKDQFYTHGEVNTYFKFYMRGYQYHKNVSLQ